MEVVNSPKLVLIIGCIGLGLNIISAIVVHGKRQWADVIHGILKYRFIQTIMDMDIAMALESLLMYWSSGRSMPRGISSWVIASSNACALSDPGDSMGLTTIESTPPSTNPRLISAS